MKCYSWLLRGSTCVFVYMRSNTNIFLRNQPFYPHCLISERGFSLALQWLVLNFWTQHPHRDWVAFNDGFQSRPRWLQTRHCERKPLALAIVDIPFQDQKKGPLRRESHSHRFITEGNQNPRQEQEILPPRLGRWRALNVDKRGICLWNQISMASDERVPFNTCTRGWHRDLHRK